MTQPIATSPVDLEAVKRKQQATWASGDYSAVGALIPIISDDLCDAADLRAGSRVLDVAGGSGNTALAAARLFLRRRVTRLRPLVARAGARARRRRAAPGALRRGRRRSAAV